MAFVKLNPPGAKPFRHLPTSPAPAAPAPAAWASPTPLTGSPGRGAASPERQRANKMELRMLFMEEQLHKLTDGIGPEAGELINEVVHWKTECSVLQRELKEAREAAAKNEQLVARYYSTLSEQNARILTLQESDMAVKESHSTAADHLRDVLVGKSRELSGARGRVEQLEAEAVEAREQHALQVAAAEDATADLRCALEAAEARIVEQDTALAHNVEQAQRLADTNTQLEARCNELEATFTTRAGAGGGIQARVRELEGRVEELEEAKEALEVEVRRLEQVVDEKEAVRDEQARNHYKQIKANDEKWCVAVATIRDEIRRCEEEVKLSAAREQRKAEIIQEYHAALTVIEDERNELLARQQVMDDAEEGEAVAYDVPAYEQLEEEYIHEPLNEPVHEPFEDVMHEQA